MRIFRSAVYILLVITFAGCGNRKSPTGGEKDVINPTILSVTPDEFTELGGNVIEIEFSKPIERSSITSGLRFYPEIIKKKIRWSKNRLIIQILEPLMEDTNYFLSLTDRIKGEHGNNLDKDYIFTFASGKLQDYKISGYINYEDPEDLGKPIKCRLSAADSTFIYSFEEVGKNYVLENLNPAGHIIEAFIDHNVNGIYDYGEEPYYRSTVADSPMVILDWQLAYEDTIRPFMKSAIVEFTNRIRATMSEEVESIADISLFTADSLMLEKKVLAFDTASFGPEKEITIDILTSEMDTLKYYLVANDIMDYKGNITFADTILIQNMAIVDTLGPVVQSVSPRNGASLKSTKPQIKIIFDEIVLSNDLSFSLVGLEDDREEPLEIVKGNSTTLILKPKNQLRNLSSYRLTLAAQDSRGNTLEEPLQLDFIIIQR